MKIEDWNNKYPVGQPVELTEDDGEITHTQTRSEAWDLCGTSVIKVNGKSGGYMLNRINPLDNKEHLGYN